LNSSFLIRKKVDWRLLPILALLHGFSLIDRNNLGIIRVAGAGKALGLEVGNRFTIVTVIFFVPFILFGASLLTKVN